jgi:hypothetical protein
MKMIIGSVAAAALVFLWHFVRAQGRRRATGAEREILMTELPVSSYRPMLADLPDDPGAVYILLGAAAGGQLDTIRVDLATGERRRKIRGREGLNLFRPPTLAEGVARVVFRGVVFPRPPPLPFQVPLRAEGARIQPGENLHGSCPRRRGDRR